jgi:hypothetical protein
MFTGGLNQVWIFGLLKQVETGVDGRVRFLYVNFVNNWNWPTNDYNSRNANGEVTQRLKIRKMDYLLMEEVHVF